MYARLHVCGFSCLDVYLLAGLQVNMFTGLHAYLFAGKHVCMLAGLLVCRFACKDAFCGRLTSCELPRRRLMLHLKFRRHRSLAQGQWISASSCTQAASTLSTSQIYPVWTARH